VLLLYNPHLLSSISYQVLTPISRGHKAAQIGLDRGSIKDLTSNIALCSTAGQSTSRNEASREIELLVLIQALSD